MRLPISNVRHLRCAAQLDRFNMKVEFFADVIVETPKGAANAYEWDAKAQVIRLCATRHDVETHPFERGHLANSLTAYGEPLPALLAITLPTFQNCAVNARVLGALERGDSETTAHVIVAVAASDARLAQVCDYTSLEHDARGYVETELRAGARWLDADAALEIVRAASRRWRLTRGEGESVAASPAWQLHEDDAPLAHDERGTFRHSSAEARLFTLPLRFQNYVAELLAPAERILLWAHRPRAVRTRLGIFGREILRQGLLVITNQQFLWMSDPVTPPHIVAGYGYIARTFALERLTDARLKENNALQFSVTLKNGDGAAETFDIEFPEHARGDLRRAVNLLNEFVPRAGETRVMRRLEFEPLKRELQDPTTSHVEETRATLKKLRDALAEQLKGETIYAQAFIPAWGGAQLLTVTNSFLHHTAETSAQTLTHKIPLDAMGSVEICNSQLDSWFRVWLPTPKGLQNWEMAFPVVFAREFSECALALRVLLAAPR